MSLASRKDKKGKRGNFQGNLRGHLGERKGTVGGLKGIEKGRKRESNIEGLGGKKQERRRREAKSGKKTQKRWRGFTTKDPKRFAMRKGGEEKFKGRKARKGV